MTAALRRRFLVELAADSWRAVDLDEVYFVEAAGDDSRVRLRSKDPLEDVRRLGQVEEILGPEGFVRIHRSYLVNPSRVLEVRRRAEERGWEVVMEPPVNRVLPVSEDRLEDLWEAFLRAPQPGRSPTRG